MPARAASHASRRLATPAGTPWMGHDTAAAAVDEVALPRRGRCRRLLGRCPDETPASPSLGRGANSGLRQAWAERTTESSGSLNLLRRPLTCR